jgi:hypothetical protein
MEIFSPTVLFMYLCLKHVCFRETGLVMTDSKNLEGKPTSLTKPKPISW